MRSTVDVWLNMLGSWVVMNVRRYAPLVSSSCAVAPGFSNDIERRCSCDLGKVRGKGLIGHKGTHHDAVRSREIRCVSLYFLRMYERVSTHLRSCSFMPIDPLPSQT